MYGTRYNCNIICRMKVLMLTPCTNEGLKCLRHYVRVRCLHVYSSTINNNNVDVHVGAILKGAEVNS